MAGKTDGDFTPSFETFSAKVYGYAVRRVPREDVEDVVAETFLVAWRRRQVIPDEPLPWLYGVARKVIANRRRTLRRQAALQQRVVEVSSAAPGLLYEEPESLARTTVNQIIQLLPESQREALLLRYWENLNNREAAIAAGCSTTAFAIRLHRARRRLAAEISTRQESDSRRCEALPVVAEDLQGGAP